MQRLLDSEPQQGSDGWRVLTANDYGKPVIVRHLQALPSWVDREQMPKLVGITWTLTQEVAFPTPEESERIYAFEDAVSRSVEAARIGVHTATVTGNGVVEWQYYATDHNEFMQLLNTALAGHPRYPLAIALQEDAAWSAYDQFNIA